MNVMCMNSECKFYWEDCCTKDMQDERIVLGYQGVCETSEKGVSDWYIYDTEYKENYSMAKYRNKSVEVEVFKWTGDKMQEEDPTWIINAIKNKKVWFNNVGTKDVEMVIETLEGKQIANRGDYIIKGVKGGIHPCKADIFDMTYEKVEE